MPYFEVAIADKRFQSAKPLIYFSQESLAKLAVVSVPLQSRTVTGFVLGEVAEPAMTIKPIKNLMSPTPLPAPCFELAKWLADYYACSLGEALRQFAPSRPAIRRKVAEAEVMLPAVKIDLVSPLTKAQKAVIKQIESGKSTTYLLHGGTGSGKTRVYLELAKKQLGTGRSVILLTPEIALTSQLTKAVRDSLRHQAFVLHSQLTEAQRKKIWLGILESTEPIVVIGPRSALFTPINNLGLIVVDEAHEPAYKQDRNPRYHAARVASQLGNMSKAKVIYGTATPLVSDYYMAGQKGSVVELKGMALGDSVLPAKTDLVDINDRANFARDYYLSNRLLDEISTTLLAKKQIIIYLNRRGTARIVMCSNCGWQLLCPHCDVPMVYHGDSHIARCHICGREKRPPLACPECGHKDLHYKTIGTKALTDNLARLFPQAKIARFDSDNLAGERVNDLYQQLHGGEIDILVGTQLLAKGLDLPKLALVGIINAESSLALPDYTSEERAFQLLYQVTGRVGRGHTAGKVIIQSYDPDNLIIQAAVKRDYKLFYKHTIKQRRMFRFPPYAHLLQLTCSRASAKSAEQAAQKLKDRLSRAGLKVEIDGPAPNFYAKRADSYYWQLVVKSKNRQDLVDLTKLVPSNWSINLDPTNLL